MLDAANRQEEAVAIGPTWAEALYVKSFALTELHRGGEALAALEAALSLAPSFSRYLAERGYMYQKAKDWRRALQKYEEAEGSVKLLTDRQAQVTERTRALRGQGYALVELGEIDAAERKYKQSLAIDPDDATSKKELDYIQGLRANRH